MKVGRIELPIWRERSTSSPPDFTVDPDFVTAPMPTVLWIELTSKCPFDCVFCTRRTRFGAGRHLDFEIYRKLIAELEEPDFVGLNYSGESLYYPRLLDAITLAVKTGAATELVTAFSTISERLLHDLVESGLDRLAISLHTMDPEQYQAIYRYGSLDLLKRRVSDLLEFKARMGVQKPRLDFCFVAMRENLHQLAAVSDFARSCGVRELSIHPIIGRHPAPHDFTEELVEGRLRTDFRDALRAELSALRSADSTFTVNVLNADLDPDPQLCHTPGYYSPMLPPGARIYSCDQSPFESVHILASGNVVVCEVHDELSLGNLHEQCLRDVWHSDRYRAFRSQYVTGAIPECRRCVWKLAYRPEPFRSSIVIAEGMSPQLLRGWHNLDGGGLAWSKRRALVALANPQRKPRVRVAGALHSSPSGEGNVVTVSCNKRPAGAIRNTSAELTHFDLSLPLPQIDDSLYFAFDTLHLFRPSLHSSSSDSRDLGVGVARIEVCD